MTKPIVETLPMIGAFEFVRTHRPQRGDLLIMIAVNKEGDSMEYASTNLSNTMIPYYLRQLAYALEGGINHVKDT